MCVSVSLKWPFFFHFLFEEFLFLGAIYKSRSQRPKITSTKSHAKVLGQYAIKFWQQQKQQQPLCLVVVEVLVDNAVLKLQVGFWVGQQTHYMMINE